MIALFRAFRDSVTHERRHVIWRTLMVFSAIKLTVFAAMLTLAGLALTRSVSWFAATPRTTLSMLVSSCFEVILFLQLADFVAGMNSAGPYLWVQAPRAYAIALMNAVAARDTAVGQETPIIPTATGAEAGATPGEIGLLAHPMRMLGQNNSVYTLGIVAAFLPMAMGVGMIAVSLQPSPYRAAPTPADWLYWLSFPKLLILIGVCGLAWALVMRRLARLERQRFSAQVDAEGVTFLLPRGAGGAQRLRWSEARAFARMMTWDDRGGLHEVFVLSDGQRDFPWEARYDTTARDASQLASEEPARVAAHRLAEVVAQRTGLPLMDVTQTVSATLANNIVPGTLAASWAVMVRARDIAKMQGDAALVRELESKIDLGAGPLIALFSRFGGRLGNPKRLSQAQRDEILRIARALLPYYPVAAEARFNAPRPWLIYAYWSLELSLQLFVLLLAIANMFVFVWLF